jgi:hypothetical protein
MPRHYAMTWEEEDDQWMNDEAACDFVNKV